MKTFLIIVSILLAPWIADAQIITGVWKGKMNKQKVEVKIIQKGDSLTGTSYYYEAPGKFRRYAIKGYFDAQTNEAVWWDDVLIDQQGAPASGKVALLARADFNCPGDGRMMLDGKSGRKDNQSSGTPFHLDKLGETEFEDEWDFVIDNYLVGGNDPDIIDSIALIATRGGEPQQPSVPIVERRPEQPSGGTVFIPAPTAAPVVKAPARPPTIEEKFTTRAKTLISEIPLTADSIELRFYDNAEIDGDSISLFLNDKLIFSHIRLLGTAYTIRFATADLQDSNELIMVAENLGTIPPNTSLMIAYVGETRHEARLQSTEGSSAMIRLFKPK